MKDIAEKFFCNIKQDTYHMIADQLTYWAIIHPSVVLLDIQATMTDTEHWIFVHGWMILFGWRVLNASMDTIKRIRDIQKPEWETQIEPLLKAESERNKSLTLWQKFLKFLKESFIS